jgi:hypothetical protein
VDSIGLHRTPLESIGIHWTPSESTGLHRTPSDSIGLHQTPLDSIGILLSPVIFHWILVLVSTGLHHVSEKFMEWIPMGVKILAYASATWESGGLRWTPIGIRGAG